MITSPSVERNLTMKSVADNDERTVADTMDRGRLSQGNSVVQAAKGVDMVTRSALVREFEQFGKRPSLMLRVSILRKFNL